MAICLVSTQPIQVTVVCSICHLSNLLRLKYHSCFSRTNVGVIFPCLVRSVFGIVAPCNFTMTMWLHLPSIINLPTEECAKCGMSLGFDLVSGSWQEYGYMTSLGFLLFFFFCFRLCFHSQCLPVVLT